MGFSLNPRHVEGNVFTDTGKWKYTVQLDYTDCDWDSGDLHGQARRALRDATERGTSGVTFREIHEGWALVVLEPYSRFEHPIMVRGERVARQRAPETVSFQPGGFDIRSVA